MVKPEKVEQQLRNLKDYTCKLSLLASIDKNAFLADFTKASSAKYLLLESIEACLDIANHIISSEKYRTPKDYADMFAVLVENNVISGDSLEPLTKMAEFRNRLVHIYWDVPDETIYHLLKKNLGDFDSFARQIPSFLQKSR